MPSLLRVISARRLIAPSLDTSPTFMNFFDSAAREVHQDAIVAWLFRAAACAPGEALEPLRLAARSIVEKLLAVHPDMPSDANLTIRSVKTQSRKRDVYVEAIAPEHGEVRIVVENKTSSGRHDNQLNVYRELTTAGWQGQFIGIYLKTGWMESRDRALPDGWASVDRATWLSIVTPWGEAHPILAEYVAFLSRVDAGYRRPIENLLADPDAALRHAHVQWHVMQRMVAGVEGAEVYRGTNRSGSPWTQATIATVALSSERSERIFWRIDQRKPRGTAKPFAYLALRAYEVFDKTSDGRRKEKLRRLASYQAMFRAALDELPCHGLLTRDPYPDRKGRYESEVGVFVFRDNTVDGLAAAIPALSSRFVSYLRDWDPESTSTWRRDASQAGTE